MKEKFKSIKILQKIKKKVFSECIHFFNAFNASYFESPLKGSKLGFDF